jgi:tetratricopeptide (TPR) repeat protein
LELAVHNFEQAETEFEKATETVSIPLSSEQVAKLSAEERAAQLAEQSGKVGEAVQHYVAALQTLPKRPPPDVEQNLQERTIKAVLNLNPAPAVPEDAQRHAAFAVTALQLAASDRSQLDQAIGEWHAALRFAPWWPEANFNLGLTLEKGERYAEATRYLKLYLLAAPNAPDAKEVQQKIYSLEYKAQLQSKK